MISSEYVVWECVWVLRVVDLCVKPHEKHRLRPQSTEGICDFGREGEAVQGPLGDLDILNAVDVSIADQRRTENQYDFRTAPATPESLLGCSSSSPAPITSVALPSIASAVGKRLSTPSCSAPAKRRFCPPP